MAIRRLKSDVRGRVGFTLVELMVCVALVLILVLGINEVFRLTSDTVGAGQAVSNALRDQRAARQVFDEDFANAAADGPYFIIRNEAVAAFRGREDELANAGLVDGSGNDVSKNPTFIDLNGDGVANAPGEILSPAVPNSRIHRIDTITFFSRKLSRRQTGNISDSPVTSPPNLVTPYSDLTGSTTSGESVVTYGHLRLPDDSLREWFDPAQADNTSSGRRNTNNKYATQWILGRNQTLLVPFLRGTSASRTNPGETGWATDTGPSGPTTPDLTPLSMKTNVIARGVTDPNTSPASFNEAGPTAGPAAFPWESKLDVAVTSINAFGQRLASYRASKIDATSGLSDADGGDATVWPWFLPAVSDPVGNPTRAHYALPPATPDADETLCFRYNASPFAVRTGDGLGQALAQTHPVALTRVSQFIVEYAGDFISQDSAGDIVSATGDGETDFVLFRGQKRIRWYGLPRYTGSGNLSTAGTYVGPVVQGTVTPPSGYTVGSSVGGNAGISNMPDVVPLSDVLAAQASNSPTNRVDVVAPHERVIMSADRADIVQATVNSPSNWLPPKANYADPASLFAITFNTAGVQTDNNANYICAWAGGGPKMVRVTLTLEDPNPKNLTGGKTYEYVYALPY